MTSRSTDAGDPFEDDPVPDSPPDDPRFEWIKIQNFADPVGHWIKGACNHLTPAPVDLRTCQLVAWWCPDCGEQFEADRWPVPDDLWVPLPEIKRPVVKANGFEKWIGADARPSTSDLEILPGGHVIKVNHQAPVNPYSGPCPHKQADWHRCAVCTAPDTPKPGPYGFDPYPRRDPDDPDYVIIWQNPRMDDNGDLIPWTRWAGETLFLPVWNGIKTVGSSFTWAWPIWLVVVNYILLMITGQL